MDFLKQAAGDGAPIQMDIMAKHLGAAFVLGLVAAGIYVLACRRSERRAEASFLSTLVLLSVLVALVTTVIGDNAARAFSLVGTLAIVRFRTVVEDTRDTAFVIFSVACGMCAGSGQYLGAIACAPLVLAGALMFTGKKKAAAPAALPSGRLLLRLSSAMKIETALQGALDRQLPKHHLLGLATARGGSALDATYAVELPPSDQVYPLVNALSAIEGVQSVEVKSE